MKKYLLIFVLAVAAFGANAAVVDVAATADSDVDVAVVDDADEAKKSSFAISPYIGLTSGVDVKINKAYIGVGKNFMATNNTSSPKFIIYDPTHGSGWWDYSPKIKTKTTELFHLSGGIAADKWSMGILGALGRIEPGLAALDSATTFGFGFEGAYHFYDNLFIKGSVTYFWGSDSFGDFSFYEKGRVVGTRLYYDRNDKVKIGQDWKLGIAIGCRFNL